MQGDDNISEGSAPAESSNTSPAPAAETSTPASETPSRVSETSGETSKETLLDAVLKVAPATPEPDVLESPKTEESPASEETETKPESEVKAEDAAEESDESDEDQLPEAVPAQTRKKFTKLLNERRKLREEVATLRPVAEIGQQLQVYAQENNLTPDNIVFALDVAAMVGREDYAGFYRVLSPLIRHAQEVQGIVLPPDIDQMVQTGQISPQAAHEYAKTRLANIRHEAQAQQMQRQAEHQQHKQIVTDVQRSVAAFEQRIQASDPDYKAKAGMIQRTAQAMLAEYGGQISTPQEALAITQRAYDEVNKQFRRLQPTARATAPTPGSSNPQTSAARAVPKNMMEAALQGLAKSRAGRL